MHVCVSVRGLFLCLKKRSKGFCFYWYIRKSFFFTLMHAYKIFSTSLLPLIFKSFITIDMFIKRIICCIVAIPHEKCYINRYWVKYCRTYRKVLRSYFLFKRKIMTQLLLNTQINPWKVKISRQIFFRALSPKNNDKKMRELLSVLLWFSSETRSLNYIVICKSTHKQAHKQIRA